MPPDSGALPTRKRLPDALVGVLIWAAFAVAGIVLLYFASFLAGD
jgi:hypothetical protein